MENNPVHAQNEGVMVDYHTQKTNIIRDEVEGDIVVF